jgi:hypothetical protein
MRYWLLLGLAACGGPAAAPPPPAAGTSPVVETAHDTNALPAEGAAEASQTRAGKLNATCIAKDVPEDIRHNAFVELAKNPDPEGAPCLLKAVREYKVDSTEKDLAAAARALAAMNRREASRPLFEAFTRVHMSRQAASLVYRDLYESMLALADAADEERYIALLAQPIPDRSDIAALKDQFFWQIWAAEALGNLRSEKAIEPLLRVMLSPSKADAQATAVHALMKIGKPSVAPTAALLRGENKGLVDHALEEEKRAHAPGGAADRIPPHVPPAALVLGAIGREDCAAPLLSVLPKADKVSQVIIARELLKVPSTPAIVKEIEKVYEATPLTLTIPPGMGARDALMEQMGFLFDPSIVPWVVKTALAAKGEEADLEEVRSSALITAMKLMTEKQIAEVEKLYNLKSTDPDGHATTLGKPFEKEWRIARDMVKACHEDVECWMRELTAPASQEMGTQFRGIKAAYMIGALGKPELKGRLVDALASMKNPATRFVVGMAIDRLSPRGDTAIADRIWAMVEEGKRSGEPARIAADAPMKTVVLRLRAKAQ